MDCIKKIGAVIAAAAVLITLTSYNNHTADSDSKTEINDKPIQLTTKIIDKPIQFTTEFVPSALENDKSIETASAVDDCLWTDDDLQAIAKTLAGECYDDKVEDKRRVCEVILNRMSDGRFGGDTVIEVLSEENQFNGYWHQSRSVSENDLEVAEQALKDWYNNDCKALSEYLFFCAGENRENKFRSEF